MSNNNKHNYSKYSSKKNPANPDLAIEEKVEVEPVIENETAPVELVEETVETVTLPKTVKGAVANCSKLNVRAKPNLNAQVVCVLDVQDEIEINTKKSTAEWLYVTTASGNKGYCMKQYVNAHI